MSRNALIICLLLLVSCKNEKAKQSFSAPDANDINEIVKTIISTNKLNGRPKSPLSADLAKITIVLKQDTLIHPPAIGAFSLNIKWFFGNGYFSSKDSSYLFFQNKAISSYRLDHTFEKIIKLTTNDEVLKERKKIDTSSIYHSFPYYEISLPIFSSDRKTAYVLMNYWCPLCGYGQVFFLKKINGRWKIVAQTETWVS